MSSAKILRAWVFGGLLLAPLAAAALDLPRADENLPPLLEAAPPRPYEVLTPLGAGKKDLLEARQQLRREGAKAQAEAVILLQCESGGMGRDGMVFYKKDAYCHGLAIRYTEAGSAAAVKP